MGKKKSVVLIVLSTIVLAALVFISVASFPLGTPYYFQPLLGLIDLSTDLGGGYYTVYYPEGVISEKEYDALVADYEARLETPDTSDDVADPADEYTRHGGVYLSADITASDGSVTERFAAEFDTAYRILQERFEQKNLSGHAVKLQDDYTVRVEVPATAEDASTLFDTFAYSGELRFTDEHFETLMDGNARYVKSAEAVQMTEDTYGVAINFTAEGQARFYEVTTELAAAASSDSTGSDEHNHTMFYLCIGEDRLLYAEISEAMNQPTVYISGSFNEVESAETVAVLINSALADEDVFSIELNAPYVYSLAPTMGENAGLWVAIAFGVLSLAMIVWSLVRYKGMGLAHVYGFLTFALVYILCISLIGGVALNIGGDDVRLRLVCLQKHPRRVRYRQDADLRHQVGLQKEPVFDAGCAHRALPRLAHPVLRVLRRGARGCAHPHAGRRHLGGVHAGRDPLLPVYLAVSGQAQDSVLQLQERGGGRR